MRTQPRTGRPCGGVPTRMQPLDHPEHGRITVEARGPQLAERTAYQLAMLAGGSGPTESEPPSDGASGADVRATRSRNRSRGNSRTAPA